MRCHLTVCDNTERSSAPICLFPCSVTDREERAQPHSGMSGARIRSGRLGLPWVGQCIVSKD